MEVKEEELVHPVEALNVLEDREEDEMSHEQLIAREILSRSEIIEDLDTLEELKDELLEIDSLKERHAYKVLEVLPRYESTVNAIFSKERVKLDDSEVQQILDVVESLELE